MTTIANTSIPSLSSSFNMTPSNKPCEYLCPSPCSGSGALRSSCARGKIATKYASYVLGKFYASCYITPSLIHGVETPQRPVHFGREVDIYGKSHNTHDIQSADQRNGHIAIFIDISANFSLMLDT